jgi:hypothetical protein
MSLVGLILLAVGAGLDEPLDATLDVIEQRCFECHSVGKVKGGLRLDTAEGWKKTIDVTSAPDSELLYRMRLPADDPDAMPPKGERVSEAHAARLEAWIQNGADLDPIDAFLARANERDAEQERSIAALAVSLGASVTESRSADGWHVSWSHLPTDPTPERVRRLDALAQRVVELSFAGTSVTDPSLAALPELPLVERVHLERTQISDEGVAALLQRTPKLSYLNLHSTGVTANLAQAVPSLASIQKVILFDTEAAADKRHHPFAAIVDYQPRRLLAVDRASSRVVLLREVGLDTYQLLWEHDGGGFEGLAAEWLGGTRSKEAQRRKGIDDGHGRVAVQMGPALVIHFDTRNQTGDGKRGTAAEPTLLTGFLSARTPWAHSRQPQRLRHDHRALLLPPSHRPLPEGSATRPQIVEKNAAGVIVWTFTDVERFPKGFQSVQIIERTQ